MFSDVLEFNVTLAPESRKPILISSPLIAQVSHQTLSASHQDWLLFSILCDSLIKYLWVFDCCSDKNKSFDGVTLGSGNLWCTKFTTFCHFFRLKINHQRIKGKINPCSCHVNKKIKILWLGVKMWFVNVNSHIQSLCAQYACSLIHPCFPELLKSMISATSRTF